MDRAEKLEDETTDLWILFQPSYKFQSNEKKTMDNC